MIIFAVKEVLKNPIYNWKQYRIVLRDLNTGVDVYETDYHKLYIDPQKIVYEDKDYRAKAYELCRFLNWHLLDAPQVDRKSFHAKGIEAITFESCQRYLNSHAKGKLRGMRGKPTRNNQENVLAQVAVFYINILKRYNPESLKLHPIRIPKVIKHRIVYDYEFSMTWNRVGTNGNRLSRYIPADVVQMLLDAALNNKEPQMYVAMYLAVYLGLRAGEICNMRSRHSPLGPGYTRNEEEGVTLNLMTEYRLRSDGKSTGKIKVSRNQTINKAIFLKHPEIIELLEQQEEYIAGKPIEEEYRPLFVTNSLNHKTGKFMAMTTKNYKDRMVALMEKYVFPQIDEGQNEQLKMWKNHVKTKRWGPHWLRYRFTLMALLEFGLSQDELQRARGDRSPESAFTYIKNSPDLGEKLRQNNYEALDLALQKVSIECRETLD